MKILNIKAARAVWLVDSRDLNPRGIDILPVVDAIKDRYGFQSYPKSPEDVNENGPKGIVFENGSFQSSGERRHTIARATMYTDGIVVDSALSTDFSEEFLADALSFLASDFGLTYEPSMVHKKIYVSELIVHAGKDLSQLFDRIAAVKNKLNSITGQNFEPAGFGMSVDTNTTTARPTAFRFEREVGKPFIQNRYYSSAPVRTLEHEELLQDLEALL